jgi:hypothetical protein
MHQAILHGLRTLALLSALASRACSRTLSEQHVMSAVFVSYGMDCRVTDVLRPQPGRGGVLFRIVARGVDPLDTRIFRARGDERRTARRIQAWLQLQS